MQSNLIIEKTTHPVKKQWLKPDIEIISVESSGRQGTFEHTRRYHLTTKYGGNGTVSIGYHS